jgi:hypothetical protein
MTDQFELVGYLVESNTGRSFKVVVDGRVLGLIRRGALLAALHAKKFGAVEICRFVNSSDPTKQTAQTPLRTTDPEKLYPETAP